MAGIWVHAASAGDVASVAPLVRALGAPATLTSTTATGRAMAARLLPGVVACRAPLIAPRRFAERVRPQLLLLERLELWPALLAAARRAGARVAIANARLSERSLARYRAAWPLFRRAVASIDACLARNSDDAERFATLGVPRDRIAVTGATKYDGLVESSDESGSRDVAVLGSTHRGEELRLAPEIAGLPLPIVVVPRYPRRAASVSRLFGARARVIGTMGDLPRLYHRAAVAFVGGSLVPRGGHNVLEPAAAGAPVVTGPHVEAVADEMRALEAAGAGRRAADARGVADAMRAFVADGDAGARARDVARSFRGATERCLPLLRPLLA